MRFSDWSSDVFSSDRMLYDCMLILDRQPLLGARQIGVERGEYRKLAGKGLGRGDADFRAGIGRQQEVGLARHAAGRHIDDDGDLLSIDRKSTRLNSSH